MSDKAKSTFTFKEATSGITEVPGFYAIGVSCGIRAKEPTRLDTAIVYSKLPCSAAGTFTTNDVKAAHVHLDSERIAKGGKFHAIVANSGNANAFTGEQGKREAAEMAAILAKALNVKPESVLMASTGRIGRCLPMDKFRKGIPAGVKLLTEKAEGGNLAAKAIMTTDTVAKTATASFKCAGKRIVISGMAKGAGMIQPNMATMLAFMATNVSMKSVELKKYLKASVLESFNHITVDGDESTNDTAILLANGESGIDLKTLKATTEKGENCAVTFGKALDAVCKALASMMVHDGEMITKVVSVEISGAKTAKDAEKVARCIGNSMLVKSAWFGGDPNWGRIMDAAGYANVGLNDAKLDLSYNDIPVVTKGTPVFKNEPKWRKAVANKEFAVRLNLHMGKTDYTLLANDLTEGYVNFNKGE
jgi:glutamate N-acetyltransferase / amino-acid N-acetyltransferase